MDGVLADFVKGAEKLTGKKIDVWAQGSKSEKWGAIKSKKILGDTYLGIQVVNNSGTS